MNTITAPKPAKPTPAQIERAIAVAAKLLRAHTDRQDRKAMTAAAFGRALVVTPPGSDHGKLLAATLRSGKWKDRPPEQRVVLKLARRGETPTAAAIASLRDGAAAHQAHLDRLRTPQPRLSPPQTAPAPPRSLAQTSGPRAQGRPGASFPMRSGAPYVCGSTSSATSPRLAG